jgi:xanthine dehydrogenase YagR molybdenum-binding subunit
MSIETNPDRPRIDAREKVRGETKFAADRAVEGLLHAMTVPATVAKGAIVAIDLDLAVKVPGVLRVFTWRDFADIRETPFTRGGGDGKPGYQPMRRPEVRHRGEPVALVVAETLEAAIEGAEAVVVRYSPIVFTSNRDQAGATIEPLAVDREAGDAPGAFAAAPRKLDVSFVHPQQFHNPIELISTTACFENGKIVVMEGTQNAAAFKFGIAGMLNQDPRSIEASSPFVGGAFGQKNQLQQQSALVVRAAMLMKQPIKLVMPRGQLFHTATYRPPSRHRVQVGAEADGRFQAVLYDIEQQNSRFDQFGAAAGEHVSRMYATPNWRSTNRRVRVDVQAPAHQRAPQEHPSSYATECAYDELAYALGLDPLALRLQNDTQVDPITGKPFTSRNLAECLLRGADRFGWNRRRGEPSSTRMSDGMLVGYGVGAGAYKAAMAPAVAKLRVNADGTSRLAVTGHEFGQGMRSVVAAELINVLGIDPDKLEIVLGETAAAPQHITVGSWGCASAGPAARAAAELLRTRLTELAGPERAKGPIAAALRRARRPFLEVEVSQAGLSQTGAVFQRLTTGIPAPIGPEFPTFTAFSWIAHFAEVHVEPTTCRIRVPRVVSVCDCGRVLNHRTAQSQVRGGVVWAFGAALRESAEIDPRFNRVVNNDLADYVLPVNADIGEIEVELLDIPDMNLNISGAKGIGEVAMVGATAAIVNAVFNATGRRIRHLPIRIEDLL